MAQSHYHYVDLEQAREVLPEIGVERTLRQIQRTAEINSAGKRKLPFFVDPVEGKLKIEKHVLPHAYLTTPNIFDDVCS